MLKNLELRLIRDWRWVVKHSWSMRFLALSCVFEGANVVLPRYETFFAYNTFSALTGLCTVAALVARFVAQKER